MLSSTAAPITLKNEERAIELTAYYPHKIADIQISSFNANSNNQTFVVKGPGEGSYIRTNQTGLTILELLDGTRTLQEIQATFIQITQQRMSEEKITSFLDMCARNGLLQHETWRDTVDPSIPQKRKISRSIGFYRPLLSGNLTVNGLYRIRKLWWNPLTWMIAIAIIGFGFGFLALNSKYLSFSSPIALAHPDAISWGLLLLPILLGIEFTMHELSHALACRLVGAKPGGFGFGLLWWVLPVFFTDTGDTYSVESKYKRAFVSAAGPLSDMVWLGACSLIIWLAAPGSELSILAAGYIGIPLSLLLFNLNPFVIRMDGYWIVTHLIEQPNLRRRTVRYFLNKIRTFFGRDIITDELADNSALKSRWRGLYLMYGLISLSWTIIFISLFAWSIVKELFTVVSVYLIQ